MPEKKTTNRQEIRQVMMNTALTYFTNCGICPTLSDLIKATTILEDYCINGYGSEVMMRFDRLDEFINQQYINADKPTKK